MELVYFNTAVCFFLVYLSICLSHYIANMRMRSKHPGFLSKSGDAFENKAFIARRIGLYLATALGAFAIAQNISESVISAGNIVDGITITILVESLLGFLSLFVFIFTALTSVDVLILSRVDNNKSIIDGNLAVGITEGAILFSTGLVAYGSLLGEGHILSSWVFFFIGQLTFIVVSYLMEYVIVPSHKAQTEIENGNIDAALLVSSLLIVIGLFVKNGIAGDFSSYAKDIPYFFKLFFIQISMFIGYLVIFEPLLMKITSSSKRTIKGALLSSVMKVLVAAVIILNVSL